MEDIRKHRMLRDLIMLRERLTWSAQRRKESVHAFALRMQVMLDEYNNLGKLAQVEFIEISQSAQTREDLALCTFLKGVRPDIRRYMSPQSVYKNLYHAATHARKIHNHLLDLKRIRIASIIENKTTL